MLKTSPAVFAVGHNYHIMVPVVSPSLMWVNVDGTDYFDADNGVMRSSHSIHKAIVPMHKLDSARHYTVCLRPLIERKPYFTQTEDIKQYSFEFHPVPATDIRLYHISDAHDRLESPIAAAKAFGRIDALILNGDLLNHAGDLTLLDRMYRMCSEITHGTIPVIYARGNHDMRGAYAEEYAHFAPHDDNRTYYTFRLGSIWGIILDCGEDKPDDHEEYGHTVACHSFRLAQTDFIHSVIARADDEFKADGVQTRIILCHNPFVKVLAPPFNIEQDIYTKWSRLLKTHIHPHVMISGHLHRTFVQQDTEDGDLPFPCPLIVGSQPSDGDFTGCGIMITGDSIHVCFTDNHGSVTDPIIIQK